jgi:hypothetical protein
LYRRTKVIPFLTWGIAISTFIGLFLLSSYTLPIDGGDSMYINPFELFNPLLIVLTAVACIVLIASFKTTAPKTAFRCLFVYLGLLAFILLALYYNNVDIPYSGMPLLDMIRPLFGLFFVLVISLLLFLLRTPILRFIAYLMEVPATGKVKHSSRPKPGQRSQAYTEDEYLAPASYEHYDEPAASYPPHILQQEL